MARLPQPPAERSQRPTLWTLASPLLLGCLLLTCILLPVLRNAYAAARTARHSTARPTAGHPTAPLTARHSHRHSAAQGLSAHRRAGDPVRELQTGFSDGELFQSSNPAVRALWLRRAKEEHASTIRLEASWSSIAPIRPPSASDAEDPAWSGYSFSQLDEAVRSAAAEHFRILITVNGAPSWAEGAGRPPSATPGTWKPNATQFGLFAKALARRYSGSFVPAHQSSPLPRISWWQAWNEPNLSVYLAPQWVRSHHRWIPTSPSIYRRMLDAFYFAIHRSLPHQHVVSGGTAPYGDPPGGQRMPPAQFVRHLFCLTERLTPARCPQRAYFDVLDHHPYSVAGPYFKALDKNDVAIADMHKLTQPLHIAQRLHLIGGPRHHEVWVTEVSWDSDPPDPHGVPALRQAHWMQQTFHLLWQEGVSTVLWYLIADQPPIPSYSTTYQSGTYFIDGKPKPSATSFRFPLVIAHRSSTQRSQHAPAARLTTVRLTLWGKSPLHRSPVHVQQLQGKRWRTIETFRPPDRSGVFEVFVTVAERSTIRAITGGIRTLPLDA